MVSARDDVEVIPLVWADVLANFSYAALAFAAQARGFLPFLKKN